MMNLIYDIFISYRRKETADKAEHLFTLLEHEGYKGRVSFDRENLDGIFGLQRGFKNVGVHSLLMSLKPVYDESTAKLMIAFYQDLAQGKTKRQSLLDAQNAIKSMGYKEGKYWAPFILLDGLN